MVPILLLGIGAAVVLPGVWDNRSAEAYLPQPHEPYQGELLARFFSPSVLYWGNQIESWAAANDLDPNLAAAVMQIESCGDPLAHSRAGAAGLFQVMPFHFNPDEDVYDPETNARRGLKYLLTTLTSSGGDIRLALAGYNGGLSVLDIAEEDWPAETRRYASWGASIYADAAQRISRQREPAGLAEAWGQPPVLAGRAPPGYSLTIQGN